MFAAALLLRPGGPRKPKAERALRHLRDQRIRAEYGPKSASNLAREHRLTERQIWKIVGRKADNKSDQKILFG